MEDHHVMDHDSRELPSEYGVETPGYIASTCASRMKSRAEIMAAEAASDHASYAPSEFSIPGCNGESTISHEISRSHVVRPRGASPESTRPRKKPAGKRAIPEHASMDYGYSSRATGSTRTMSTPRSISAWSLWSSSTAHTPISPRENIASMRRKQLSKMRTPILPNKDVFEEQYLTPSQRKDKTILDLRHALDEVQEKISRNDEHIQEIVNKKEAEHSKVVADRDVQIYEIREQVERMREEIDQLKLSEGALIAEREILQKNMLDMEVEQNQREERHQEMYLVMYEKGQKSADFVRQDTLEETVKVDPESVSVPELLQKLENTQVQLAQLQNTERENRYQAASMLAPTTDSEATLRCVKDALYHHLTETEKKSRKQHLDIMINLAGFTAPQLRKIERSLLKGKAKS